MNLWNIAALLENNLSMNTLLEILSNEEMLKSEPVLSCPVYWLKNTKIFD